ncbi:NUDIX domain-containing protein [Streptomyces purpureus]|uniref:DNA mismatch repair protein MutT n=1 Tax=Streptomyces purpureus TaxID=1951 RepID=A0A918LNL5_9ACTN|nr:NUDIX domain-containing protein [Streptomyces purpureus]GGT29501.1 DNA mismatch repair protein MutT [Streptomyces purpureus]
MPVKRSAGLLLYRTTDDGLEVLIGHMGGPFWERRDVSAWSIPKGEYGPDETAEAAARREFEEELGLPAPDGEPVPLGEARQSGGKIVTVWAVEADLDPTMVVPGTFSMEWPRGSGTLQDFPEIDKVGWFTPEAAAPLLVAGQRVFLDRLVSHLGGQGDGAGPGPDEG